MKQTGCSCIVICVTILLLSLFFFFIVGGCSDDTETTSTELYTMEQTEVESRAITMARQIVKVNLHTSSDVDFSNEEIFNIGDNAYNVLGHYTVDGVEHKFDLRLHYKGGEWTSISNWEWSRLQLMRVGATDLDEDLHGTWTTDIYP